MNCAKAEDKFSLSWRFVISEVCLRTILLAVVIGTLYMSPNKQEIWLGKIDSIIYPYASKERVSDRAIALIYSVCIVGMVVPGWIALSRIKRWRRRLVIDDALMFFFGISGTLLLTLLITEVVKSYFGRLRPDFLYRCYRLHESADPQGDLIRLIDSFKPGMLSFDCGANNGLENDGRKSFPSGHASSSTSVFLFLGLWLQSRLRLSRHTGLWGVSVFVVWLLAPGLISLSRLLDYRHHVGDIVGGSLIGALVSLLVFSYYWSWNFLPLASKLYDLRDLQNGNGKQIVKPTPAEIAELNDGNFV